MRPKWDNRDNAVLRRKGLSLNQEFHTATRPKKSGTPPPGSVPVFELPFGRMC
jgi:hypothetical protein